VICLKRNKGVVKLEQATRPDKSLKTAGEVLTAREKAGKTRYFDAVFMLERQEEKGKKKGRKREENWVLMGPGVLWRVWILQEGPMSV